MFHDAAGPPVPAPERPADDAKPRRDSRIGERLLVLNLWNFSVLMWNLARTSMSSHSRQRPGMCLGVSADPHLNRLLIRYCEEALSRRPAHRGSFRSGVENEVVRLLPHGKARAGEIARRLGISQRTLTRVAGGGRADFFRRPGKPEDRSCPALFG